MGINDKNARIKRIVAAVRKALPLMACLFVLLCRPASAALWEETKNVLVIYSYKSGQPFHDLVGRSIRETFEGQTRHTIEVFNEYLDISRFPHERYRQELVSFLRRKYSELSPDLIITVNSPALDFMERYGATLFPGIPTIFCAPEGRDLPPGMTGTTARFAYGETLELALKLHPGTREVVVIGGTSETDLHQLALAREQLRGFAGRVDITYLTGLSMKEILAKVAALPEHTLILYVNLFRDGSGKPFIPRDVLKLIADAASVPVYSGTDAFLGYGMAGGRVLSYERQGRLVAEMALRLLEGADPAGLSSIGEEANAFMFDWRQLKRWGISESLLPPGSIVRFREPSIWERYKWEILIGAFVLAILEALLIVAMVMQLQRRRRAERALRDANRELDAFVYTVSHDLRSPLSPIIGYAEFLEDNYRDRLGDEGVDMLRQIRSEGNRMLAIMEDLLDLARVGHLTAPVDRVDCTEVLEDVLMGMRNQIAATGMTIQVGELPAVRVPRTLLTQIFDNLLGNALRYAAREGSSIEVGGERKGDRVRFQVRDHGPGIPEEERTRVFDLFYRGTTGKAAKGTGVGLATVQKIARLHSGRAWVEETPGGGSTFVVELRDQP
ncbi:MAG: sensor histidine kinase [Geobacter sp.]|nr:sensor histidine kinase [Geobacter sp.]